MRQHGTSLVAVVALLVSVGTLVITTVGAGIEVWQESAPMCTPNHMDPALRCNCLTTHPGWCDEDIPPPNCCKAGERKMVRCGCCLGQRSQRWVGKLCSHS